MWWTGIVRPHLRVPVECRPGAVALLAAKSHVARVRDPTTTPGAFAGLRLRYLNSVPLQLDSVPEPSTITYDT